MTRDPPLPPDVTYRPAFLPPTEAADLFDRLVAEVPWGEDRLVIRGHPVVAPRLVAWLGDPGCDYRYSGRTHRALPWTPTVAGLRDRVSAALGHQFNSVLCNFYRSGADAMGWHADNEPELGPAPVIASLSLGATRRFLFKAKADPARRLALELAPGSLLLMAGSSQRDWLHALPRTRRPVGPRVNLTFRRLGT